MRRERAFALVIVVSFIALLTALVTEFGYDTRINVKEVESYEKWLKAFSVALSGISGGKALLKEDFDEDRSGDEFGKTDFYIKGDEFNFEQEIWSQVKKMPVEIDVGGEKGVIFGNIVDECGKLNVNGLVDSNGKKTRNQALINLFVRFFEIMGAENPEELVNALIDWIDADEDGLYETSFYMGLDRPYTPRNGPFSFVSEIKLITLIADELKKVLFPENSDDPLGSPFLTVFSPSENPTDICINVNTAPTEILMALNEEIDEDLAEEIIEKREKEPFKTLSSFKLFLKEAGIELNRGIDDFISFNSTVFSIKSVGMVGNVSVAIKAVVRRRGSSPSQYPFLYFRVD